MSSLGQQDREATEGVFLCRGDGETFHRLSGGGSLALETPEEVSVGPEGWKGFLKSQLSWLLSTHLKDAEDELVVKNLTASAGRWKRQVPVPPSGRSPGGWHDHRPGILAWRIHC